MPSILQLVQHPVGETKSDELFDLRDIYDFDSVNLDGYTAINISASCDQRFLAARSERLSGWVSSGGKLLVNGHPMLSFVEGLPKHRKLEFHSTRDLWLTALGSHPIWEGVDRKDLLFNTGVPGQHSFAKLTEIGVAGFYAHAYLVDLPESATEITGIGQGNLPVDISYPLGAGEVIVHLGNDLTAFDRPGTSAQSMTERIFAYLAGNHHLQESLR